MSDATEENERLRRENDRLRQRIRDLEAMTVGSVDEILVTDARCRACKKGVPVLPPRRCPECGKVFAMGWAGIDGHWKARHEDVMSYEEFWASLCRTHGGGSNRAKATRPPRQKSQRTPVATMAARAEAPTAPQRDAVLPVVCGVDGCRDGWVVVYHDLASGRVWWEVALTLGSIAASTPPPAVIAIDVPIGLLDSGSRRCDTDVRRLLARRGSSVFPAPIRPLLAASSWEEANSLRKQIEDKGLSAQSWGIVAKIREVDEALRSDSMLRGFVREAHPELCFSFMNDGQPMVHYKKKAEGRAERVAVLRNHFGDVVYEAMAAKRRGCQLDDLLDAFAAVWTAARVARGEAVTVPAEPPRDRFGLPMEMVV